MPKHVHIISKPALANCSVITGPTASGKTSLAQDLAHNYKNAELINLDSRQVYKYLDIGTDKGEVKYVDDIQLYQTNYPVHQFAETGIKIHLLSFLNPQARISAHDFRNLTYALLEKLWEAGKYPILVGGSGFYLQYLLHPENFDSTEPDPELRQKLEKKSLWELQTQLQEQAPELWAKLNHSDRDNKLRLMRKLENLTNKKQATEDIAYPQLDPEVMLVKPDMETITANISQRVEKMWQQGLVQEVQDLIAKGYANAPALQGVGYREVMKYLHGEVQEPEAKEKVKIAHRRYAKKQLTWFSKYLTT